MTAFLDPDGIRYDTDHSSGVEWLFDLLDPPAWHALARCRGADPNLFFPETKAHPATAVALCRVCPVIAECAAHADAVPERYGIWAGKGSRARERGRRRPRVIAA